MKKLICLLLALFAFVCFVSCSDTSDEVKTDDEKTEKEQDLDYLVLVNKENKLPDYWEKTLKTVTVDIDADGDKYSVETEEEAYSAYLKLKDELEKDGIVIDLDSGRRTVAAQQKIVDDFTAEYGEDYVKKYVAVPGYSEHHTGLAIDIFLRIDGRVVNMNEDMVRYTPIWAKIHEKLADFGFILRYLDGKETVTGYSYEPWHIRYVGSVETAKEIYGKGLTLEEYLNKLPSGNVAPETDDSAGDGQNPVMNFIGDYEGDGVKAHIAVKDKNEAQITVIRPESAESYTTWTMSGKFDPDYLLVAYSDAVVCKTANDEKGEPKVVETYTEAGIGSIQFDGQGGFVWNDQFAEERDIAFAYKNVK